MAIAKPRLLVLLVGKVYEDVVERCLGKRVVGNVEVLSSVLHAREDLVEVETVRGKLVDQSVEVLLLLRWVTR